MSHIIVIFTVIIISLILLFFKCSLFLWCVWCQWCFLCSMYRYYQTLTLKRHPGGRSSWCPFYGYAPFLVCIFRRFSALLPISSDFFRVKCPSRESAGKKEGSRHSTPKTYSKRFFSSLFPIAQENKPFILPSTAFSVPGWYKSIPKKKKPVTGLPGAYTGILHFKA